MAVAVVAVVVDWLLVTQVILLVTMASTASWIVVAVVVDVALAVAVVAVGASWCRLFVLHGVDCSS